MAKIKTHIEDTQIILRQPDGMEEVHRWLDEFAKKWPPHIHGEYHRKFRHNRDGLEQAISLFGYNGGCAAKIHFIRDVYLYILKGRMMHDVRFNELDALVEKAFKFL